MSTPPPVWPPQPGSPSPYGAPQSSGNATLVLVLGILSLFICGIVLGPIAWIQGNSALVQLDSGYGDQSQRGTIVAGRICGIIGTVLSALILVIYIGAIIVGVTSGTHHGGSVFSPTAP